MANDSNEPKSVDSAFDFLLSPGSSPMHDSLKRRRATWRLLGMCCAVMVMVVSFFYALWWRAPFEFPTGTSIAIKGGMTLGEASDLLAEQSVVRSSFWFKAWSIIFAGTRGLKAGDYYLSNPSSTISLARRFTFGIEGRTSIRITIPEGLSNANAAAILSKSLPHFDERRFLDLAKPKEGYLFPDTYIFPSGISEEEIIKLLEGNFWKRTLPLRERVNDSGRSLGEVVTMASLIEGEVRIKESRRLVSGILWKRLERGMPLQVDAVFPYMLGKNTYQVTTEDLQFDSPYNTYLYSGLPPGPINNPSIDAIEAALAPTSSEYLYYLTDKEGQMRYATTHAQHLINRAKYLGK